MKKFVLSIACLASTTLYADVSAYKYETSTQTDERNELISANVNFIRSSLAKRIKIAEVKLKNYKETLSQCQTGEEVQFWLKKVQKLEKKIKNLDELLIGIDLLHNRVCM